MRKLKLLWLLLTGSKMYTLQEVKDAISDLLIFKKEEFQNIFKNKVLVNKEYDPDNLNAYEVKSISEEENEIKITLSKNKVDGIVRLASSKESSPDPYRFVRLVDSIPQQAYKKNEILFTYDKLGE